ncbi:MULTISPECIES: lysine/arginine/ornithine ABC transporter substrate-binding protein [Rhizobium]|uniref:Octopine/nopaline transport system substrate-binding protein n=1 Tax=Rhizobium tropici TaxID=398 RepID=A0A6P1C7G5_RHITR|nr:MULTISPECIES: lysine/arginine/ornithine ABC transporter substrate-binding protein [Rhizobium]AGB75098.1 putative amino acid ABC transporter, substrate-binding protein [Rhizobium tropici CIAT 899]MBB4242958.1 octopine/nopaline transport system substrate-binding protein [Rhizobium tropici]MBB5594627.1 octopine/nopaline transport system substrate-binding protein [Rhizobium tropici]MBB6493284.1 octopine/nopaline transport system substrate-binding protein [Rhizobium tropici]NEV11493.1 transporte
MQLSKLLLASVLLGVISVGTASAETKPTEITIATEGAYEPWNFTGPDGKLAGFEIDLANDLCARMKIKCTIVAQDWDGLIPSLNAKKFDAIMASMIVTEKRLAVISFSEPYAPTAAAFMVDKTGPLANLPGTGTTVDLAGDKAKVEQELQPIKDALKGKTVGAQVSTANAVFLDTYFKGVVDPREYKTVEQHDLDLQAGRIDAVVAQKTSLTATLRKDDFKDYTIAGPTFKGGVFGQGIAAGLRKDDTVLKSMFDAAIKAAKADGTINKLAQKWIKTNLD